MGKIYCNLRSVRFGQHTASSSMTGKHAMEVGYGNKVEVTYGIALGDRHQILNNSNAGFATGQMNIINNSSTCSVAMGGGHQIISSVYAVAIGNQHTINNASNAMAFGSSNTITGRYSAAIGSGLSVSGQGAIVSGINNSLAGNSSFVMGSGINGNTSSYSIAIGFNLSVQHSYTALFGQNIQSDATAEMVMGYTTSGSPTTANNTMKFLYTTGDGYFDGVAGTEMLIMQNTLNGKMAILIMKIE